MNKSIAVAVSCLLVSTAALADDMMKKDSMPMEPKMEDTMKNKPMHKDAMKKESMHKEMKKDGAAKDAMMPHDDMRKDVPAQPAASH